MATKTKVKDATAAANVAVLEPEPATAMPVAVEPETSGLPEIPAEQLAVFTVQIKALKQALNLLKKLVDKNANPPITKNVLIECVNGAVYFQTANLGKGYCRIYIGYANGADCSIAMPYEAFAKLAKSKRTAIELRVMDNTSVNVYADGVSYNVPCESGKLFPVSIDFDGRGETAVIRAEVLKSVLSRAIVCASDEDLKPAMQGVYVEEFRTFVATDAHKLFICERTDTVLAGESKWIMPAFACGLILQAIEAEKPYVVAFAKEWKFVRATIGNVSITFEEVDGRFPDYYKAVPTKSDTTVMVGADYLAECVAAVMPFTSENTNLIRVKLNQKGLIIDNCAGQFETDVKAEVEASVTTDEKDFEIGFNAEQLLDVLEVFKGQTLRLGFGSPGRVVIFEPVVNGRCERALACLTPVMLENGKY